MGKRDDWFRRSTWTEADQADFSDFIRAKPMYGYSYFFRSYDPRLNPAVASLGGWLHLLSPDFTPDEGVYSRLEQAGLDRSHFDELRQNARTKAIKNLASWLYWQWRWLLEGKGEVRIRLNASPFHGNAKWQDFPFEGLWADQPYGFAPIMEVFAISKDELDRHIESNPEQFPLVAFWPD